MKTTFRVVLAVEYVSEHPMTPEQMADIINTMFDESIDITQGQRMVVTVEDIENTSNR